MSTADTLRSYRGPALLAGGFRPFFLLAPAWAAVAMLAWVLMLQGSLVTGSSFGPVDWHAHELLYGYVFAVVAGFLLTAVPNWTGRLPVAGWPLAGLALLWLAGRAAVYWSAAIGPLPAALADLAFGVVLMAVIGREIVLGRNWRNGKVLVLVGLLLLGNGLFHWQAAATGYAAGAEAGRLGTSVAIMLIALIGGRIVPSFTRNWLVRQGANRLPVPFGRFDGAVLLVSLIALIAWTVVPEAPVTALAALIAALLQLARLARWSGLRTWREPLLAMLHVAYLFVPLGFLAVSIAVLRPGLLPPATAGHVWLAGAVGLMTVAVMARASLGHTGRPLSANAIHVLVFAAILTAVLARLLAGLLPGEVWLLHVAATAWIVGFGGFGLAFAPVLLARRRTAEPAGTSARE